MILLHLAILLLGGRATFPTGQSSTSTSGETTQLCQLGPLLFYFRPLPRNEDPAEFPEDPVEDATVTLVERDGAYVAFKMAPDKGCWLAGCSFPGLGLAESFQANLLNI